jgi:hypothetical protein
MFPAGWTIAAAATATAAATAAAAGSPTFVKNSPSRILLPVPVVRSYYYSRSMAAASNRHCAETAALQSSIERYIAHFINKTKNGNVFTCDLSTLNPGLNQIRFSLTEAERDEREVWATTREALRRHYKQNVPVPSCEEFLRLRVAPPLLSWPRCTSRSWPTEYRAGRRYPKKLGAWEDFEQEVDKFKPEDSLIRQAEYKDVLHYSLQDKETCSSEIEEQIYIRNQVLGPLRSTGLLRYETTTRATGLSGNPDLALVGKDIEGETNIWVPMEFKSTQNLLVPFQMDTIVFRYNQADEGKGTPIWSNIGQPLSQLFNYMIVNNSRCGVLSSGTRTYFLYVNEEGTLLISDAWLVGKENYLRAWAYFFLVARAAEPWVGPEIPNGRNFGDHPEKPHESRDSSAGDASGDNHQDDDPGSDGPGALLSKTTFTTSPSSIIPLVNCEEVEFVRELGRGNNQVRLARWRGREIAVKCFDMFKNYDWFEREVRAYEHLRDVWGEMVPEPYFISDMYGALALLGMQLGRDPNSSDEHFDREHDLLFSRLLHEHGFEHLDAARGNVIYIPDGQGGERLVAMDLESHEILGATSREWNHSWTALDQQVT